MYGVPINLLYRGEGKFKTVVGGFASIIAYIIILVYILLQIKDIKDKAYSITSTTSYVNLDIDMTPYNVNL